MRTLEKKKLSIHLRPLKNQTTVNAYFRSMMNLSTFLTAARRATGAARRIITDPQSLIRPFSLPKPPVLQKVSSAGTAQRMTSNVTPTGTPSGTPVPPSTPVIHENLRRNLFANNTEQKAATESLPDDNSERKAVSEDLSDSEKKAMLEDLSDSEKKEEPGNLSDDSEEKEMANDLPDDTLLHSIGQDLSRQPAPSSSYQLSLPTPQSRFTGGSEHSDEKTGNDQRNNERIGDDENGGF